MTYLKANLAAIDLDGTLLTTDRRVSQETLSVVSKVVATGVHVILVSARMPCSVLAYRSKLGLKDPVIACGGALVVSDSWTVRVGSITPPILRKVIDLTKSVSREVQISIYDDDRWYVEAIDAVVEEEMSAIGVSAHLFSSTDEFKTSGAVKVTLIGDPPTLDRLSRRLISEIGDDVSCVQSRATDLDIVRSGVSKGKALAVVCEWLNIPSERVVAIGDHTNDLEMLKFAGTAVAVDNATADVKQVADLIVPSNDSDGVAVALRNLFLKGA